MDSGVCSLCERAGGFFPTPHPPPPVRVGVDLGRQDEGPRQGCLTDPPCVRRDIRVQVPERLYLVLRPYVVRS